MRIGKPTFPPKNFGCGQGAGDIASGHTHWNGFTHGIDDLGHTGMSEAGAQYDALDAMILNKVSTDVGGSLEIHQASDHDGEFKLWSLNGGLVLFWVAIWRQDDEGCFESHDAPSFLDSNAECAG
jgi:hypothetical protein